ncbi:DUF3798 domain-containing protein [Inediibacterium massiliense]|uniref:DUF3798 domain-containing protein n=1 Tax=Inediibacterium massiliense TaxID=1658111 RepID=UPI0006B6050C|nr:DUF3798 domain-containing protein [Inediibacterium massiliense]
MLKRSLAIFLIVAMVFTMVACGSETKEENWKIGIMTGTVSQNEEEYRAAEKVQQKYGKDKVLLQTYPDQFMKEQETVVTNVMSMASDPDVKAIIIVQGIPGTSAAIDKVREMRDDILFIIGTAGEDPAMIASKADVVFQMDELGMGKAVIEQAKKQGATKFVHYSFPRHMSYALLAARRDLFRENCEKLGLEFIEATAPDPTGDAGVSGAQQYILEDVPRKVQEYGKDTAFFATNCSMQEPLIKSILEQGAIFPQQCCPSPYHGYPGALGIEIPEDKKGDIDFIVQEIKTKISEKDGTKRFSTWPVPMNMMFVEAGTEYALEYIKGNTKGKVDMEKIQKCFEDYANSNMHIQVYTDTENQKTYDNYLMVLSDFIDF